MLSKLRTLLVCTLAVLFHSALLRAQAFTNPYRLPTPNDPYALVVADFNGDGHPDIAWIDTSTNPARLHVLLAQGDGTFLPVPTLINFPIVTTRFPVCVAADFNQDGRQDLACSQGDHFNMSVLVLFGNGDGTFQTPISTAVPTRSNGAWVVPLIFSAGDLNGDGRADVIVEEAQSQEAQVLLGDGKGGFRPGIEIQSGYNYPAPVIADVNGDGKPDILWPIGPEVELGNGDGTFSTLMNYSQPSYSAAICTFHDMDGDGHLDAVCGYGESSSGDTTGDTDLIILHGNTDGSFNTTPISQQTFGNKDNLLDGFGTFEIPIAVADLNGDGIPDILASSGDGLAVLLGGAGLIFTTPLHYAAAEVGYGNGVVALYEAQIFDMNGDGIPDIVAAGPNGIYITYGKKDGTFASAFAPEVTELIGYPTVADFNGDGIPDIAATGDSAIKLSLGKGDGTFSTPTALPNNGGAINFSTPLSASNARIVHGDFNGDGKLDLLAIGSSSIYQYDPYLLLGHGDGTFDAPRIITNSSPPFPLDYPLTDDDVFDINHDGRSDLLSTSTIISSNGPGTQIYFSLSNGDGTFKTVSTTVPSDPANLNFYPIGFPALADFNRDGKLDAVYGSITNAYVVNGHGDGTFDTTGTALPIPPISGASGPAALSVATGDFDGDGNQDFVVLANYNGTPTAPGNQPLSTAAWVFYGNGNSTFSAPVLAATFNHSYTNIAAADLNKDGLADIVVKTSGSLGGGYVVGVFTSQPGRTFGPEINYTAGTGLSSLAITDVNRDGLPDLIFGNGDSNVRASSVTVLLNQANAGSETTTTLTCTPSTLSVGGTSLLSAAVTSTSGTPTGSILFTDNGTTLSQPTLTNGVASDNFTARQSGTRTIVATYVPTGSFPASSASCALTVSGLATTATLSVAPTLTSEGSPVTLTANVSGGPPGSRGSPVGSITFYNGSTVIDAGAHLIQGTVSFTTTTLPPGIDYLTCTYSGNATFAPSTCNIVPVTITQTSSAITLTSSLNPAPYLTPITFTAQVAPGSSGTIVFNVNGQNITTTPNAAGTSSTTTNSLTPGSYLITATYFATPNALAAQASLNQVVIIPVAAPDFSLTGTNTTLQINHNGTGKLLVASLGTFSGTVALTCNPPYPQGYTCTLQTPNLSLPLGFNTYVIYTLSPNYSASSRPLARSTTIALAALFPLGFFGLMGLARRRRTTIRTLLYLVVLTTLASITTACGPDHFIPLTTGTYPITFTGVGTSHNDPTPITHTVTVNATITP